MVRWIAYPIKAIIFCLSLIDLAFKPIYRPIVRALISLTIFARIERQIAALPRLAILVLLAVPFAIAEPMKVAALVIMAKGSVLAGLVVLAVAYLANFLIVERIYHAGRGKLLTYRWLAWIMRYVGVAKYYFDSLKASAVASATALIRWLRSI